MQVFSDMTISGASDELRVLLARLDSTPRFGEWERDREAEEGITPMLSGSEDIVRCFFCAAQHDLPSARLWLDIGKSEWAVTNIVPADSDSLSPSVYKKLLDSFKSALEPLAGRLNITISNPVSDVGPEHWLSSEAVRLLHTFSVTANKSTGASHPRDRARWNAFVIAANRGPERLAANDLEQILIEHENWPQDKAGELALLFEYETSLLNDLAHAS